MWCRCAHFMDGKHELGVVQNESWLSNQPGDGPNSLPGLPLKGNMLELLWSGIKEEDGMACSLVPTHPC